MGEEVVDRGRCSSEVESVEYLGDRWEVRARFRGLPLVLVTGHDLRSSATIPFAISTAQTIR
jgi:hypothetical protein